MYTHAHTHTRDSLFVITEHQYGLILSQDQMLMLVFDTINLRLSNTHLIQPCYLSHANTCFLQMLHYVA